MPARFPDLHLPDNFRGNLTESQGITLNMLTGPWEPMGIQYLDYCDSYLLIMKHIAHAEKHAVIKCDGRWTTDLNEVDGLIDKALTYRKKAV